MPEKNEVISILQNEKNRLEKIIKKTETRLAKAPEGNLRVQKHGKSGYQYFFYRCSKDVKAEKEEQETKDEQDTGETKATKPVYIPASERKKAFALIQKQYDQQILAAARKQAAAIGSFLKKYDPDAVKRVYSSLIEARKTVVEPVELPDDLYAELWQNVNYERKKIPETAMYHCTGKGERVRSKSEVIIADALARAGIPYRYEYPLQIGGQILHPDFTVLRERDRKEYLWEHFGLIDETEYRNNALKRIWLYESKEIFPGDKLIITAETQRQPLNIAEVNRIIRHYLL